MVEGWNGFVHKTVLLLGSAVEKERDFSNLLEYFKVYNCSRDYCWNLGRLGMAAASMPIPLIVQMLWLTLSPMNWMKVPEVIPGNPVP
jgi:hypothetical protein